MNTRPLRRLQDLPGPRAWPLLGNTLQVKPPRIHRDVEAWADAFGPLFRMRLGRNEQLVVADHELLAALIRAFGEEGRRIAKTAAQYAAPFSTQGFAEKVEACYMKAIEAHKRG